MRLTLTRDNDGPYIELTYRRSEVFERDDDSNRPTRDDLDAEQFIQDALNNGLEVARNSDIYDEIQEVEIRPKRRFGDE